MDSRGLPFTAFTSDHTDQRRGLWGKVFFNFTDPGNWFARGYNSLPNIYGPIGLFCDANILGDAKDVSITLTSVTSANFDRGRDSLTLEQVKSLFEGARLKSRTELQASFPGRRIMVPEMNVSYEGEEILTKSTWNGLSSVVVDPISFGSLNLYRKTVEACKDMKVTVHQRRTYQLDRMKLLQKLALTEHLDIESLLYNPEYTAHQKWLEKIIELAPARGFMLRNYLNYLYEGTLKELLDLEGRNVSAK